MNIGDVITTAEELGALPAGAVVLDAFGKACQRLLDDGDALRWWRCSHRLPHRPLLPASLIHLDDRPARPERVVKAEALREAAALVDAECPHEPDEHAEGSCDICDFAFAVTAQINERADRIEAGDLA